MFNLEELEQFIAFSELGTLSKVAEKFLISSPSLSRSMQHVEDDFGVPLFHRSVNKITLNETGFRAVEAAKEIIAASKKALQDVRQFDQSLKTISISSAAPAPLWSLLPQLTAAFPNKLVTHQIKNTDQVLKDIEAQEVSLTILPYRYESDRYPVKELMTERLYIAVKPDHELAKRKAVTFEEINGYNFLLQSEIGFWSQIHQNKMPASKFLIQNNPFEFNELVRTSSLPRFVTNLSTDFEKMKEERVLIPINDAEATATFYLVILDKELNHFS